MRQNTILKIVIDISMTVVLLFLMAYERIGEAAHEWLGIGMFGLLIAHHILNRKWSQNLFKGKYTWLRIWQTILVALILLMMAGSMYSGMILSKHALSFLPIKGGRAFARNLHMISAYWGMVWMSLHLGLHGSMMIGIAKRYINEVSAMIKWLLRGIATFFAGYGVYAFIQRKIGQYMLLQNHFVFFDFEEPLVFFLADYIAVIFLFSWIGHYFFKGLKVIKKKSYML